MFVDRQYVALFRALLFSVLGVLLLPGLVQAAVFSEARIYGELYDPSSEAVGGFDVLTAEIGTQAAPKTASAIGTYGESRTISGWTLASAEQGRLAFELQSTTSVLASDVSARLSAFVQSTNNRVRDTISVDPGEGPGGVWLNDGDPAQVLLQIRLDGEIQQQGRPSGSMQFSFTYRAGSSGQNLPIVAEYTTGGLNPPQAFEIDEAWDLLLDVTVGESYWIDQLMSGWINGTAFDPGTSGINFIKIDPIGRVSNAPGYDLEITSEAGAPTTTPFPIEKSFDDVALDHWAFSYIETLAESSITAGCEPAMYCPSKPVTRAQMAVFLERCMNGSDFVAPPASGNVFLDVDADDFAANYIEQLYSDGITAGCGGKNYCPGDATTRAQMAVLLLRAKYGSSHVPPAATGVFDDVPLGHWAASWIEQLAADGITGGCGGDNYCPDALVKRDQMAVFLVRTCGL